MSGASPAELNSINSAMLASMHEAEGRNNGAHMAASHGGGTGMGTDTQFGSEIGADVKDSLDHTFGSVAGSLEPFVTSEGAMNVNFCDAFEGNMAQGGITHAGYVNIEHLGWNDVDVSKGFSAMSPGGNLNMSPHEGLFYQGQGH